MKVVTQHYFGTTQEWHTENPVIYNAVWAFEKTTEGRILAKLGNGVDCWNNLKYFDIENIKDLPEKLDEIFMEIEKNTFRLLELRDEIQNLKESNDEEHQALNDEIKKLQEAMMELTPEGFENIQEMIQALQEAIDNEAYARQEAINNEAQARQEAIDNEIQAREDLQRSHEALQDEVNSFAGRGGFLKAFDFGMETPDQIDLTNYALSQIPFISNPTDIFNSTRVINLFNNHTWVLTNTQDTDPPIFEWTDQGLQNLLPFKKNMGGYIVGADPETDSPEYVFEKNGKGKIDLEGITEIIKAEVGGGIGSVITVGIAGQTYKEPVDFLWDPVTQANNAHLLIQEAINFSLTQAGAGRPVFILPGTYNCSDDITLGIGTQLSGVPYKSRLVAVGSGAFTSNTFLIMPNGSILRNLEISIGSRLVRTAILASDALVENNTIVADDVARDNTTQSLVGIRVGARCKITGNIILMNNSGLGWIRGILCSDVGGPSKSIIAQNSISAEIVVNTTNPPLTSLQVPVFQGILCEAGSSHNIIIGNHISTSLSLETNQATNIAGIVLGGSCHIVSENQVFVEVLTELTAFSNTVKGIGIVVGDGLSLNANPGSCLHISNNMVEMDWNHGDIRMYGVEILVETDSVRIEGNSFLRKIESTGFGANKFCLFRAPTNNFGCTFRYNNCRDFIARGGGALFTINGTAAVTAAASIGTINTSVSVAGGLGTTGSMGFNIV